MTDRQKEIVLLMAQCNMNASAVARKAYMHRSNVLYHIEKIEQDTGLDPKNFYDLVKLVETASKS